MPKPKRESYPEKKERISMMLLLEEIPKKRAERNAKLGIAPLGATNNKKIP